jgi:hypothetical protein
MFLNIWQEGFYRGRHGKDSSLVSVCVFRYSYVFSYLYTRGEVYFYICDTFSRRLFWLFFSLSQSEFDGVILWNAGIMKYINGKWKIKGVKSLEIDFCFFLKKTSAFTSFLTNNHWTSWTYIIYYLFYYCFRILI